MTLQQFSLAKHTALVTGASSGIGHGLAKGLAAAGASVVAAARRVERLHELVGEIEQAGGTAIAVAMDVTDTDSIGAAYTEAQERLGVVDIIINNAGVAAPRNFLKTDPATLDFVMETNFNGVWQVAQEGARRLVDAGRPGSIINIASVLGLGVQPGQSAYCASKGAVLQLTRAMANDLMKYGIRVNAIAPGWFKTEINAEYFDTPAGKSYIDKMPARRLGRVEELIGPAVLLASAAGSFINGAVLPVDGAIHTRLV
ncbi:SDR family oxidoreductase [Exilibacterium tricleocarpae]|uniref:SDR family oxidoreductase n=1 Tax=Exilibacterium tricleocarpae TaxID=2591008 RepID=A0A545U9D1_9GAMM|nr:SDR family NAD(P)-dependent oxidoreductase [Exilibacterium tricleocarpae]TQV86086.1 SDR family oxidoreductase [Exilibacterium tricleocarpae]